MKRDVTERLLKVLKLRAETQMRDMLRSIGMEGWAIELSDLPKLFPFCCWSAPGHLKPVEQGRQAWEVDQFPVQRVGALGRCLESLLGNIERGGRFAQLPRGSGSLLSRA